EPLFIDASQIDTEIFNKLKATFNRFRKNILPPLKEQLQLEIRREIDTLFLQALGFTEEEIPIFLDSVYNEVARIFEDLDVRSRHTRKRE
ncbi:MAG: hypothetical protein ACFE7R_03645, partial [Candidatus Hodarchaeota archaeon]